MGIAFLVATVGTATATAGVIVFQVLVLDGQMLLATMVVSIFPTANNLFAIAHRYEVGVAFTRDVSVITALVSMPALIVIAAIFHV